eukprot:CAMPEP_0172311606 /NCGR_PEP_ID=MMETSP1058-20130122/15256_1 /TAXON_ID=83371 /ORGANISM="Detonula confervacea, Strain CCMP 353" /LENGTH=243 /DNA_ID=CAMNT_0013024841 /DNA_START=211 /DNA_END=942 /DNA_ORIENTATION=+
MASFASFYLIFALSVIGRFTNSHVVEGFTSPRVVRLRSSPISSCPPSMFKHTAESPSVSSGRHTIPHPHRIKSATALQLSNNNNEDEEEYNPRDNLGRGIRGLSSALKTTIDVGDTVVCKRPLPNLGIYENSSYEVTSIYTQYFDEETQQIVKQQMSSLDTDNDSTATTQNKLYMTLFSPQHHPEGAVIVTPEEVGLASVREELGSAAWLAVPGFFWVFLAASFLNTYHERTGGSISDAFLGR